MIGLIPAAGHATRIDGIAKYLLPTPGGILIDVLRARMRQASVDRILIGIAPHTTDILRLQSTLFYTVETATMSETVLAGRKYFCDQNDRVLFGMPDSYWSDESVYQRLAADLRDGAVVSVALFEAAEHQKQSLGMCAVRFEDDELRVVRVVDKPRQTDLHLAWGVLAWSADFWRYIDEADPHVGYALQRAIMAGIPVRGILARGPYFDCGTPESYFECIRHLTGEAVMI